MEKETADWRGYLDQVSWDVNDKDGLRKLLFKTSSAAFAKDDRAIFKPDVVDDRQPLSISYKYIDKHQPEFSFMFKRSVKKGPKHLPNSLIFTEEWRFYDHEIKFTKIIGPSFSFVNKEYNSYQL